MANSECKQACEAAYNQNLARLNSTLFENLVLAGNDPAQKTQAQVHFSNGMKLAQEARDICLAQCGR